MVIHFEGSFIHHLSDNFFGGSNYEINIKVNGEIKNTDYISHFRDLSEATQGEIYFTHHISLSYVTELIPQGEYNIEITCYPFQTVIPQDPPKLHI